MKRVSTLPCATASSTRSRLRSEVRDKDALTQRLMSQHSHMQDQREGGGLKGDHRSRMSAEAGGKHNTRPTSASTGHHTNIVFLPPHLHPSRPLWSFFANFVSSWRNSKTTWLAVLWVTLFLIAIGLLVGLLVPWNKTLKMEFTTLPVILAPGSTSVTALFSLSRAGLFYYAVIPASLTDFNLSSATLGRRLLSSPAVTLAKVASSDLINLFEDGTDNFLAASAVACGRVLYTNTNFNYTLTINSQASLNTTSECVESFHVSSQTGLATVGGSSGDAPFANGRCQRCGLLVPNTLYVLLMLAENGRKTDLLQRHFLTEA